MEIVWSNLAKETLKRIVSYIENNFTQKVADKHLSEIMRHVDNLKLFPHSGGVKYTAKSGDKVRSIIYNHSQVYYIVRDETIHIIVVWDDRQNPNRLRKVLEEIT